MDRHVTLFHAPNTRSAGARVLLEELGADYDLHVVDFKKKEQRNASYLKVNPMGKVPAILHGDALVTEQPAIYTFLADLYADKGLAPALDDPQRGPYLRWMAFYGSSFEPALIDKAMKRDPIDRSLCPYGDYDTMLGTLAAQLRQGPYLLGERFTAVDVLWGTALGWTTAFKLVPELPEIMAYVGRVRSRPAFIKAAAADEELAASSSAA
jgi:glutathione S-transferase